MVRKLHITESEKKEILGMHLNEEYLSNDDVVFVDWLSPDEKYVVFMDQLIEIETKTNLGDIWKNSDNLFFFLEHCYKVSDLPSTIKEGANQFFSKRLIMESEIDFSPLKTFFKKLIKEDFWSDTWVGKGLGYAGKYLKKTGEETVKGLSDFAKEGWEGLKKFGIAISKGDWNEIVKLLGQGALWMGRKIRQAAYSPVGMVIDAILIATGVGKVAQVVVWAIVVGVDIYELVSGDYEHPNEPFWMRILFMGVDVLGLVFAGAAAKAGRSALKLATAGVRTEAEMGAKIAKSPTLISLLKKIVGAVKDLPTTLKSVAGKMSKNSFWGKFFSKALNGVGKFIEKFLTSLGKMFSKETLKPVAAQIGLITGIGATGEYFTDDAKQTAKLKQAQQEKDLLSTIKKGGANFDNIFAT